jgi:hypothetical protein
MGMPAGGSYVDVRRVGSGRGAGSGGEDRFIGRLCLHALQEFAGSQLERIYGVGEYKVRDWLGAVAEAEGEYGKVGGVSSRVYTYTVGPQISWPRRISPFAHALFGLGHFSGGGYINQSLAANYGGGIDMKIKPKFSWRVIEGDLAITRLGGVSEHSTRVSTGIVFHF